MQEIEDITTSQKEAIEELRRRIEHEFSPRLREDDTLFYRFLKARDFNLKAAETMLRKHLLHRETYGTDTLLSEYVPPQLMKEYFPTNFVGYDKEGLIIRYFDIGGSDHKAIVNVWSLHQILQYNAYLLEQDFERMKEQTKKLGRPITKFSLIVNMDGMTLAKATYKKGIETAIKGFQVYQDNYPERVVCIYIINASLYFTLSFSIIKNFLATELLKKIRIYGKDGWKEDLLKIIDADVLPAFLGGNRTDPDGNPLCNTFIVHGKPIPEEFYNKKLKHSLSKESDAKKLTVTRFSYSEIKFYVYEPNSYIEWEFETKTRDIGFALYYKDNSIGKTKVVELIPKHRIDTTYGSETGVYKCDKVGTYIIVFDNTYSWWYSKEIYYRIHMKKSNEIDPHLSKS